MQPIKAFVSYSFSDDDNDVVSVILKCLDRVRALHSAFAWEHAKEPEPTTIDAKVLSRLKDANLLIAICTKRERVVSDSVLSRKFYAPGSLVGKVQDFEWKTSDWIIQEIGVAVGKGMDVILLLEDDTRLPGALQGALEWIPFNRKAPEKCYDKLQGMIASLSPHAANAPPATAKETDRPNAKNVGVNQLSDSDEWLMPKSDWTTNDYELALYRSIALRDQVDARRIDEQFLSSPAADIGEHRQQWAAFRERLQITWNSGGDLAKIEKLFANFPHNWEIADNLARCYSHYERYEKAAKTYQLAANAVGDVRRKIEFLGSAALCHQRSGNKSNASALEDQMKQVCAEAHDGEREVLESALQLADARKEHEVAVGVLERLLELYPGQDDTRFELAYKHLELDRDNLATYHYARIPVANRSAIAWNNLGVSLSKIGLPIKAISAFKKSHEQGETLATSNLAHKYLEAGFLAEAKEMLHRALQIPDHHKNIDKALGTLQTAQEAEIEKEKVTLEKSKPISSYYRQFGRALSKPITEIQGLWKAPKCELAFTVNGTAVIARGSYETPAERNFLGLIAAGGFLGRNDTAPVRHLVEYRGEVRGRTVVGSVSRRKEGETHKASAILLGQGDPDVLMWVADSGDRIHVLERKPSSEGQFYTLERI